MPDPVLVPPTPTVNQGDSPEVVAETVKNVQAIFDRVAPPIKGEPTPTQPAPVTPPAAPPTVPPQQPPTEPVPPVIPPAPATPPPETPPPTQPEAPPKIPSFIEDALRKGEPVTPPAAPEEMFPESPPEFKTPEERNAAYRKWRGEYNNIKEEVKRLRERPAMDETTAQRLSVLETQNKEMAQMLDRAGVEAHHEFQNQILRPMHSAWNEACRIYRDVGGDPNQLARAMTLTGGQQFQALDEAFQEVPESAKAEINNALTAFRRFDEQRRAALQNAPRTAQELHKRDMQRQVALINQQKEEMKGLLSDAVRTLREDGKVEVLMRSSDPEAKWWNDQADNLEATARQLYLENTDMRKMAMACVLAPMADVYRKLWMQERMERLNADKVVKEKLASEPNLSESGGPGQIQPSADLSKPFNQVFLETFHRMRETGR